MNTKREHLWQAYIDGELSATEAAAFEATLSESERRELTADVQFDRALSGRLSADAACPDAVWAKAQSLVEAELKTVPIAGAQRKGWYWAAGTLAAAASIAFAISLYAPTGPIKDSSSVIHAASSLEELTALSEVGPGRDAAQRCLDEKGVDVDLVYETVLGSMGVHHHPIEIVGAREAMLNGDPVAEVLLGCCGHPVKLLLARHDSAAAHEIGLAAAQPGDVQATRVVGDYLAAVVAGGHPAHELLDIFGGQDP